MIRGLLSRLAGSARARPAAACDRPNEPIARPTMVSLDQAADPQCPLLLLREISPPEYVRGFLKACESEVQTCLAAIEEAVERDAPVSELQANLHRLRNAFTNACLTTHVAAMPLPCVAAKSSAHYGEHLPVLRALSTQALHHLQSQPEFGTSHETPAR